MNKESVLVMGLGYVGLPLVCAIAESGKYEAYGYDIDKKKIELIKEGKAPIKDSYVENELKNIKFVATYDESYLDESDIVVVCVPTPVNDDFTPDYIAIKAASETISRHIHQGQIIIIESTVNPGACNEIILPILESSGLKGGKDFDLAHCPERIDPGNPIWNIHNIPRNVGALTTEGTKKVADFYRSVIDAEINETTSIIIAEATKIVENTFRDINIAYVNELAKSFDNMGIDLTEVIKGASSKPFGFLPHYPGCGVGGHCIPVDPYYLIDRAQKNGFNHEYLKMAREVNNSMPKYTVDLLMQKLNELCKSVNGTKIGILGISYKKNVGDIRESPALRIISIIRKMGGELFIYDPYIKNYNNVNTLQEALKGSEALVLTVDHDEIKKMDLDMLKDSNVKIIIDGRNCLNRDKIEKMGILYKGIGH